MGLKYVDDDTFAELTSAVIRFRTTGKVSDCLKSADPYTVERINDYVQEGVDEFLKAWNAANPEAFTKAQYRAFLALGKIAASQPVTHRKECYIRFTFRQVQEHSIEISINGKPTKGIVEFSAVGSMLDLLSENTSIKYLKGFRVEKDVPGVSSSLVITNVYELQELSSTTSKHRAKNDHLPSEDVMLGVSQDLEEVLSDLRKQEQQWVWLHGYILQGSTVSIEQRKDSGFSSRVTRTTKEVIALLNIDGILDRRKTDYKVVAGKKVSIYQYFLLKVHPDLSVLRELVQEELGVYGVKLSDINF